MSQLQTHLLAEDPSIVLMGRNTVFRGQVLKMLQQQNLEIVVVDSERLLVGDQDLDLLENAYKVIWLYEHDAGGEDDYLNLLSILKEIKIPITIISNLITNLDEFKSDLLQGWKNRSEKQTQFVVDCNYHLPKANFIFGQDIVVSDATNTSLEFIAQNIHKGIVFDPGYEMSLLDSMDFLKNIRPYLFRPGKQSSILIKGKSAKNTSTVELLKRLYGSYHNVNLEIIKDLVSLQDAVPFSVEEKLLDSDLKKIVTSIIKKLQPPQEDEGVEEILKPDEDLKKPIHLRKKKLYKQEVKESSPPPSQLSSQRVVKQVVRKEVFQKPDFDKKASEIEKSFEDKADVEKEVEISVPEKKEVKKEKEKEIDVNSEIQRIFKTSRTDTKVNRIRKIAKNTKKITKKSKRRRFLFVGGIGITGAAIGVLALTAIFFVSQSVLKKELMTSISRGIINKESTFAEDESLRKATDFVGTQVEAYGSVFESNLIIQAASMVDISEGIQSIPEVLLGADEASKNLVLQVITGDIGKTSELAEILNDKVRLAYDKLSSIQASLKQIDFNTDSDEKNAVIAEYETKLSQVRSGMSVQQQLQPILGSLTGETSKKTYAVILQNNQELRPTGGFIQAVALLNFDKGSLVSYNVYSVYELDKRLSGEVVPPEDLKKYLGEEKWYLRDSNWNPDFPATSKQVTWFLTKILGVDVDGVVALNLFTLKDILEATGPMELSEYNEVITHKNILERMEFHSEVVLVDSPKSADYSVTMMENIIEKIANVSRDKVPALVSSFRKSLDEGQLMISTSSEGNQLVLHSLGWTGSLIKPQCPTQLSVVDCDVDILAQVEANIGINKANYYLDRSISHNIKIDRKKATHSREITFKNNAKSNSWPKGTYKSYQRFYLDKSAILDKVLINGSALVDEQISKKEEGGLMELGIRVDVPIQQQVVVELRYSTPHNYEGNFSYVFFNQRQPGTSGDPLRVTLEHAEDLKPVLVAPSAEVYGNIISFVDVLDSSLFGVEFE